MKSVSIDFTNFKQTGRVQQQLELLLQAWECAFGLKRVTYLSGPVTTGPRFVSWYRRTGSHLKDASGAYQARLRKDVVEPNCRDIYSAAARLRSEMNDAVIEPGSLSVREWSQQDYLGLWSRVIDRFVERIVLMAGWEYSAGCAAELYFAVHLGVPVFTIDGARLALSHAVDLLLAAAEDIKKDNVPVANLAGVAHDLAAQRRSGNRRSFSAVRGQIELRKDRSLDKLAELTNVAQFVSFSPSAAGLRQEYCRILGFEANHKFRDSQEAVGILLERSAERSVNLRSFTPQSPQNREFVYGVRSVDEAVASAKRLGAQGLNVIVNETVDVHDGGVSGVLMGDLIEFTPDDTPRGVEKPGLASLPRSWGISVLSAVYRFVPDIDVPRASRLEFSVHPQPRGWRHTHTLGWEYEAVEPGKIEAKLNWPNRFSRMIGDKVYGLVIAHVAGLPVPRTLVLNRRIAPFAFGQPTGSEEIWLRTSPPEQVPGKFTTVKGWIDPFKLLHSEDPKGTEIVSVLCQAAIQAVYAGAAMVISDNRLVIEGKRGEGQSFMKGSSPPENLPSEVRQQVEALQARATAALGPVRFEWVFDGNITWVVQLHRGATTGDFDVIVPGEADVWIQFDVRRGLEDLRNVIRTMKPHMGLLIRGEFGLTSHVADVIRRSGLPARCDARVPL